MRILLMLFLISSGTSSKVLNLFDPNPPISVSHKSGFYADTFALTLRCVDDNTDLYYTTNGAVPTTQSTLYSAPIDLAAAIQNSGGLSCTPTTPLEGRWHLRYFIWKEPTSTPFQAGVVRFRAFKHGIPIGKTHSRTYFIDPKMEEKYGFHLVSIVTDSSNFFDYNTGLYVPGVHFDSTSWEHSDDPWWPPGNYQQKGKKWERPAHVELFDAAGASVFAEDAGLRITGAIIGGFPIKSLRIVMRDTFGKSYINDSVFPNNDIQKYKRLLLRTSGNDFSGTLFRDALLQSLLEPLDMELQASLPSIVFINGEYWGIHNIREKTDKHYIRTHFNLSKDSFDLLENYAYADHGSNVAYVALREFMKTNDITSAENYAHVVGQVDIDNFINYQLAEIYYGNSDWPGNNVKLWKSHRKGSKWRWLIFDLDVSFGYSKMDLKNPATRNSLYDATTENSKDWWNPASSTFTLRTLLKNKEFRQQFICRYLELSRTLFAADYIVARIDSFEALYAPEIPAHIERWGYPESVDAWKEEVEKMRIYARERPGYFAGFMQQQFGDSLDLRCE
jgi:hypothetical protein